MMGAPSGAPEQRQRRVSPVNGTGGSAAGRHGGGSIGPERRVNDHEPRRKDRSSTDDAHQEGQDGDWADAWDSSGSAASTGDEADGREDGKGLDDDEETGLTANDRQKRRRKKRRNAALDARVVGGATHHRSMMERTLVNQSILRKSLINAMLIGLWYLFSLSISIYNKWMFSPKQLNFHFPLFTTSMHMLVQFSLASLVLYFIPRLRPRHDSLTNPQDDSDVHHGRPAPTSPDKPLMTRYFYLTRIGPCGAATGLDIGLGNMSLYYITLTFYTMCKSSSLAFVLLFAFVFHLESPSIRLCLIILTMTIGVIMMVFGETFFDLTGFVLVISASLFSGFRWALTQILLLRNPATSNPFSSIFFLAPIMFVTLLAIALPAEGVGPLAAGLGELAAKKGILGALAIVVFPGFLAFCMTSSEFALLQRTSVITLSICGIFKEVVTISAAGIVFGDPLTRVNVSGLLVTIASIAAYNYIKIKKMRDDEGKRVEGEELHGGAVYEAVAEEGAEDALEESDDDDAGEGGATAAARVGTATPAG